MKPHNRVMLFCLSILFAPVLFSLGDWLAELPGALLLSGGPTLATLVYMLLGDRREPPLGGQGQPPLGGPPRPPLVGPARPRSAPRLRQLLRGYAALTVWAVAIAPFVVWTIAAAG